MDPFAGTSAAECAGRAIASGREAFGAGWLADRLAIAPGRIELLGNHLDYNGGPVLAAAIDRFIAVAAARDAGPAGQVRAVAADVAKGASVSLDAHDLVAWRTAHPLPVWSDYLRGLLAAAQEPGHLAALRLPASLTIAGDVPIGFGVSSSAALCVALALALLEEAIGPQELVLLAQAAEHRAGTPCGTMDQSASVAGGVIAFNGWSLAADRLSPPLDDLVFVVADSGVDRSLGASSYPTRVAESREALERLRRALGIEIPHLAALSEEQLQAALTRGVLPEPLAKRARHVVEETARVDEGRAAMAAGDWRRFGELMTASGRSSAILYEISHPRVEELVGDALAVDGVLGARMMGGGEGGSALMLLPRGLAPRLEAALLAGFYRRHGMDVRNELLHVCAFAPGAMTLDASAVAALT
jgi:galactokinase